MASGDVVVQVLGEAPPGASFAQRDTRAGGSTPAEQLPVFDFDAGAGTQEYMDWLCQLEGYGGGGLTFSGYGSFSSATTGGARVGIAIRRLDTAEDIDAAHTYAFNEVTISAPATNGQPAAITITFTAGADMDSLADGEAFILRFYRDPDHADDDAAGDFELWGPPVGTET